MADLRWYVVELDANGKCIRCREASTRDEGVHVVRAASPQDAIRQAVNAHAAKLLAERRARYRKEGLCTCGRKRENSNLVTCRRCLERHKVHKGRHEAKQKGAVLPPLDRRTVLQERKSNERLDLLLEVQAAWQDSTTNGQFTRWLNQQIEAAGGVKRAG